jgi:nitric oxide dioxygenase
MTPDQISAVKTSFAKVAPIADQAATLFYDKLFSLDPSLRQLFPADMTEQKKKLFQILATAVNSLENLDAIIPAVKSLGARHVGYGVVDAHYVTVGEALLWTLEQGLGADFTPAVKTAWGETYTLLADTMKAAAHEVRV